MKKTSLLTRFLLALILATHPQLINRAFATSGEPSYQTVEQIRKAYPHARVVAVSPDEYRAYRQLYAQNSVEVKTPEETQTRPISQRQAYDPCWQEPQTYQDSSSSNATYVQDGGLPRLNFTGGGGKADKEFLIVVAVIGVVVVAALFVYSIAYLYQVAAQGFDCKVWNEMGYRYSHITDRTDSQIRDGDMSGLYYSVGYKIPIGVMGLTGEIGYHDFSLQVLQTSATKNYNGTYFLAGPSFSFPFGSVQSHAFQVELLAGTSTEKDIGLMSTLRFGADLRITPNFSLGLNLGAALVDIKGFDNYIKDSDHLNYLSGVSASVRW